MSRLYCTPRSPVCLALALVFFVIIARAQVNSWTNPASGNWEDYSSWSLNAPPGTNQTILVTNANWKAVNISSSTVVSNLQSLKVDAIIVSSPIDTFNTLLLNFVGLSHPLVITRSNSLGSLTVASNSAVVMFSSALHVENAIGGQESGAFSIGGTFREDISSEVTAGFLRIGNISPGVFTLTNSALTASAEFLGGPFSGLFLQNGGTNSAETLYIDNGQYDLYSGTFSGGIYFTNNAGVFNEFGGAVNGAIHFAGGLFNQSGGAMSNAVTVDNGGIYRLGGGFRSGVMSVPAPGSSQGGGSVLQTGGTNSCALSLGAQSIFSGNAVSGSYTLSNGVLVTSPVSVNCAGTFTQWGGTHNASGISAIGSQIAFGAFSFADYFLNGGRLSAGSLGIQIGTFTQAGGTNQILGDVSILTGQARSAYFLSGGLLTDTNTFVAQSFNGGFFQSGGTHVIVNTVDISAFGPGSYRGYELSGGELVVSNIHLSGGGAFHHTSGVLTHSGLMTMSGGILDEQVGSQQFGPLRLQVDGANTNSVLSMASTGASILHFANSSAQTWSGGATLTVENWNGSLYGGGQKQLVFGQSASALTIQEVASARFFNPSGLSPGTYPARILPSGELVPDTGAPLPTRLDLSRQTNGVQVTVHAESGHTYGIEASTDLVHWQSLTSQMNPGGTIFFTDTQTTNHAVRFYRAVLLP